MSRRDLNDLLIGPQSPRNRNRNRSPSLPSPPILLGPPNGLQQQASLFTLVAEAADRYEDAINQALFRASNDYRTAIQLLRQVTDDLQASLEQRRDELMDLITRQSQEERKLQTKLRKQTEAPSIVVWSPGPSPRAVGRLIRVNENDVVDEEGEMVAAISPRSSRLSAGTW